MIPTVSARVGLCGKPTEIMSSVASRLLDGGGCGSLDRSRPSGRVLGDGGFTVGDARHPENNHLLTLIQTFEQNAKLSTMVQSMSLPYLNYPCPLGPIINHGSIEVPSIAKLSVPIGSHPSYNSMLH